MASPVGEGIQSESRLQADPRLCLLTLERLKGVEDRELSGLAVAPVIPLGSCCHVAWAE